MTGPLIRARGLVCGYGKVSVVRGLDLDVAPGEVVCLLGPNGAGKTTTLLTVAGVLPALAGELDVLSAPVGRASPDEIARRGLTLVPAGRGLFFRLTVAENLKLRRRRGATVGLDDVLGHFPALVPMLRRRTGLLSGGEQQMLALAGALLSDPRVIMIDELSLGLAPKIVAELLPVVRDIARSRSIGVVLVEQHVAAALRIADRGYVMAHGEVIAAGTADELRDRAHELEAGYLGRKAG